MAWTETADATDEHFHPRNDDPWWNESSFITFRIPDRKLMGLIYYYFRPNQNTATAGPMIWDPTGETFYTMAHNGFTQHMPIPPDADMSDFKLDNGFTVEMLEPQQRYRFTYDSPGCTYDLIFTSSYAPHYMRFDKKKGEVDAGMFDFVKDVPGDITTGHYEHYGRMNGTLELNGEHIEVRDAVVFRDRTWGPRKIMQNMDRPRGGYSLGMGSDDNAFTTFAISDLHWQNDPVEGTRDPITSGFYVKNGVGATIVSGSRQRLCGPTGRPVGEIIDATDDMGRTLHAEGEIVTALEWPNLYNDCATYWCYEQWTFDGHTAAPGELQDWMMTRHHRKWMQERSG
ncbi:MAG TPA: hypothetical protein VL595_30920 [Pseudonocardia sp.]|jgi:hypothetical protein|nr:hypothetical protein [Pseudonocardia sp.]